MLIDFGLSYNSGLAEDKAVDLYVLERAFASTHPDSQSLFSIILQNYAQCSGKAAGTVLKRLDEGVFEDTLLSRGSETSQSDYGVENGVWWANVEALRWNPLVPT